MKLSKSKDHDVNYLAAVIEIESIQEHPNAEKLQIIEVFGGNVIIGKGSYSVGQKVVYFPIETSIEPEFLSWANLFSDPNLNKDEKSKGFFEAKGTRVKPIRLRGIPSEGFVYPVDKLAEFYGAKESDFKVGETFDEVGGKSLVKKWVRNTTVSQVQSVKVKLPKWLEKFPRPIRKFIGQKLYNRKDEGVKASIVPGQFQFHYSTPQLSRTFFVLSPEDEITASWKLHGTSAVFCNILAYEKQGIIEKVFKRSKKKGYKFFYASRSVLKTRKDETWTDDVWGKHAKEVYERGIPEGITIFGELVGYSSAQKQIQKKYDYGCSVGQSELYVYRITHTDKFSQVRELSFPEIQEFCETFDLKTVPVIYQGKAKDLFPEIPIDENWSKAFVEKLSENYLEKDCEFCKNKVPAEGVVVKIDSKENKPVFKHKSVAFKFLESKERDSGESNIEEES